MNRRSLLIKASAWPFLSLSLVVVTGCGGEEESAPAEEPNVGPGSPPGPAPAKGATSAPAKPK